MKRQISYIEKVVCAGERLPAELLHDKLRGKRNISDCRMAVMTLALEFGNTQIEAEAYFKRGHPCAINARNAVADLCATNRDFRIKMDVYRNIIERGISYEDWTSHRIIRLRNEVNQLQGELNRIAI